MFKREPIDIIMIYEANIDEFLDDCMYTEMDKILNEIHREDMNQPTWRKPPTTDHLI